MVSRITGVWRLRSAEQELAGTTVDWFGPHPDGLLIATEDLHFTEAITRTDLPLVVSGDRLAATPEENRALAQGTLASYGTYRVDDRGEFVGQHVEGSTFPDWNDTDRDNAAMTVRDGQLVQSFGIGPADVVRLTWDHVGTAGTPTGPNQVAATWRLASARATTAGQTVTPFGPTPSGYLIFADSGWFTDVLHRPGLPAFASGDRLAGSDEENALVVRETLMVFGTYTVDDAGVFRDEQVLRSSFPNWSGMRRDTSSLTETVRGDVMTEHLDDGEGVVIDIEFTREPAAG